MGAISITGEFLSGSPYTTLLQESLKAQVQSNYNWYAGDIGTIHTFNELELVKKQYGSKVEVSYEIKDFMSKHPLYKSKQDVIRDYLIEKLQYMDKGELVYAVDYSSPSGYEIVTYGGKQEININQLPEKCRRYLNTSQKGYTLFKLAHKQSGLSVSIEPCMDNRYRSTPQIYNTLQEVEETVRKDVVYFRNVYFTLKNDGTRAYMINPNIKHVKTTTKKTDHQNYIVRVDEVYPVYYAGMAAS